MKKSVWITVITLALVVFGAWGITGYVTKVGVSPSFVECLAEKGVIFAGAEWCPHCQDQKTIFGRKATKALYGESVYVECPENQELCKSKGVTGYPT
ncbi:MAG: protein disulfide isomerase family protein, partial [Nanoarchaeota archaeon]